MMQSSPISMSFIDKAMILRCNSSFLSFPELIMHNPRLKPTWPPFKDLSCLHYGLGLLVAGLDLHQDDALSSALAFWQQFKDIPRWSKAQFQNNRKRSSTLSFLDALHAWQKDFEIPSYWRCILLALGPWIPWLHFEEHSQNIQAGKRINMASFYGTSPSSGDRSCNPRFWTNILIGLNILMFVAQEASHGRLLLWGAKVNSLIDQGQLWRLITPALLHANIGHLLINCYSLNSIGPVVESLQGRKRFIAVYAGSALTGVTTSYFFSTSPSVGSSGAIFGLAGSLAVFLLRHRNLLNGGQKNLLQIARIITANMVLGLISPSIDNWGHLGGLLGGAFFSWLLGPAWSFESLPGGGRKILIDQPPIERLLQRVKKINS